MDELSKLHSFKLGSSKKPIQAGKFEETNFVASSWEARSNLF